MSGRSPATRGAPKGSVQGSTLFSIFISNLDGNTVRFVNDFKLSGLTNGKASMQMLLYKLEIWANRYLMMFNMET